MRAGRGVRRVPGLAGSLLIAAVVAVVPVGRAGAVTARAAPEAVLAGTGVLDDVVAITPRDAWAVGHYGSLAHPRILIEHWNGTAWHRMPVSPAAGWLDSVAATSARDVWATGLSGTRALILHFDGAEWRRVASPAAGHGPAVLAGVAALSRHDGWAAGITGDKVLIEHWNGTSWTRVPSPSPQRQSLLSGVSAASPRDVWAVGGISKTLILHWNGIRWRRVPSPSPGTGAVLDGVTAVSARDAWATGSSARGALILHWNGTAWRPARIPAAGPGAALIGITATSPRSLWAVGATAGLAGASTLRTGPAAPAPGTGPAAEPLILHWNGTTWRRISIPRPASGGMLIGTYAASRTNTWAVGCTRTFAATRARPLALHWNGTAWK